MKLMTKLATLLVLFLALTALASDIYNAKFWGPVTLGSYAAIQNFVATDITAPGGTYVGSPTYHYKVLGTNFSGKIPSSSEQILTITHNAAHLQWDNTPSVHTYAVIRSDDGLTWDKYRLVPATTNVLIDLGTGWSSGDYETMYPNANDPASYPWSSSVGTTIQRGSTSITGTLNTVTFLTPYGGTPVVVMTLATQTNEMMNPVLVTVGTLGFTYQVSGSGGLITNNYPTTSHLVPPVYFNWMSAPAP